MLNVPTYTLAGLGGINLTSLSATSPLLYDNTTGVFSIQQSSGSQAGFLSAADWTTFNSKQGAITLTTSGSSGAATFSAGTLNIPNYTLSGLGGVPTSRTLTINGVTYDLSADRSWTVSSNVNATNTQDYTATANQTVFTVTGGYTVGQLAVFYNGSKLASNEFTATNGTTFTLATACQANDIVQAVVSVTGGGIGGSGTTNYISKWSASGVLANSQIFDNGTNVGIGTASPANKLTISNNGNSAVAFRINDTNANASFLSMNASNTDAAIIAGGTSAIPFDIYTGGNPRVRITTGGNLYIGTTTGDGYRLQVVGNTQASATISQTFAGVAAYSQWVNSSGAFAIGLDGAAGTTERLRVTSAGFLKQRANGGSYFGGSYNEISNLNNVSGDTDLVLGLGSNTINTSSYFLICANTSNDRLFIYGNGNIVNTNGSYGTLSDASLKENIVDATPKLDDLLQLKVRNFNLINDEEKTKQIGFIAQEFEEVFPTMVDTDGKSGMKTIKTSVLVPMLVKAIQELKAELDSLKQLVK